MRSATDGTAQGEAAAAPFAADRWLFSHNGRLTGWPAATGRLAATLPPAELLALEARTDSALVWALVLHRLRAGESLPDALAETVADLDAHGVTGRFNFLLTDGEADRGHRGRRHAVLPGRAGRPRGLTVVASEPTDDEPGWCRVPDRSVLTAPARRGAGEPAQAS